MVIIPNIFIHDIGFYDVHNSKEICNCVKCTKLKNRRDLIYKNKWYSKLLGLWDL